MDSNCKPSHARAYNVPRSVEQQLEYIKKIVRLVDIGFLEEDYSSEWDSPSLAITKKNGESTIRDNTDIRKLYVFLNYGMSPISNSNDWESGYDPFNGRVFHCFSIGFKYGLLSHQSRCWLLMLKAMYNYIPMAHGTWENTNTNSHPWVSRLPGS
jgi:hypothetical protein